MTKSTTTLAAAAAFDAAGLDVLAANFLRTGNYPGGLESHAAPASYRPSPADVQARLDGLDAATKDLYAGLQALAARVGAIVERIEDLPAKPTRGRPPKAVDQKGGGDVTR